MNIRLYFIICISIFSLSLKAEVKKCSEKNYLLFSWISLTDFDSLKNYAHKNLMHSLSIRDKYLALEIEGNNKKEITNARFYSKKINLPFEIIDNKIKLNLTGFDLGSYLDQDFKVEITNKRGESCEIALDLTRS